MKNIMIVAKQGNALALGDGINGKVAKSATGTFIPNLLVLKEVLSAIPTEPTETVNIHIMDTIQGLVSGSAVEYVKSGKTASGNALTAEEVQAFKEVYELYAQRILNVRFSLVRYIKKDNTAMLTMKTNAYNELDKFIASTGGGVGATTTIDPDKELRAMFDEQIKSAMGAGDMALMRELMAMRKELKEPTVVSGTSASRQMPAFDSSSNDTDLDSEIQKELGQDSGEQSDEDNNDPIVFEDAKGKQQKEF